MSVPTSLKLTANIDMLVAAAMGVELQPPCYWEHKTDDVWYDPKYGWNGWCYTCGRFVEEVKPAPRKYSPAPRKYSTDIGAAWEVVKWLEAAGWDIILRNVLEGGWEVVLTHVDSWQFPQETVANTVPMAICLALLNVTNASNSG